MGLGAIGLGKTAGTCTAAGHIVLGVVAFGACVDGMESIARRHADAGVVCSCCEFQTSPRRVPAYEVR